MSAPSDGDPGAGSPVGSGQNRLMKIFTETVGSGSATLTCYVQTPSDELAATSACGSTGIAEVVAIAL